MSPTCHLFSTAGCSSPMRRHGAHSETRRSFGKVYEVEEGAYGGARARYVRSKVCRFGTKRCGCWLTPGDPKQCKTRRLRSSGAMRFAQGNLKAPHQANSIPCLYLVSGRRRHARRGRPTLEAVQNQEAPYPGPTQVPRYPGTQPSPLPAEWSVDQCRRASSPSTDATRVRSVSGHTKPPRPRALPVYFCNCW